MAETDRFKCVRCALVYTKRGSWDLPQCPRCGSLSNLFPEKLAQRDTEIPTGGTSRFPQAHSTGVTTAGENI